MMPFFAEVHIRSKLEAPLTVQEERIFSAERVKVVPIFTKTQTTLSGRSANEQRARPGSSFQWFLLAPVRLRRCRPQSCRVDDHLINLGLPATQTSRRMRLGEQHAARPAIL